MIASVDARFAASAGRFVHYQPPSPSLSIIVPTYKEVENIPFLVDRINAVREENKLELELLLMDDDSRDGSAELVEKMGLPWARLVTRDGDHGLSQAVLDGLRIARHDTLLVMDADLSHPPEKIPEMLRALAAGADFVIGSRFVPGGSTDDNWGILRWLNSRVATLFALPLARVKDPMSGFFMLRKNTFTSADPLNPVGYKIGLELLVKCRCKNAVEVPIRFTDRLRGESKLSLSEQLRYLRHVLRLYEYKFYPSSDLRQFLTIGCLGTALNLLALTAFVRMGLDPRLALALSVAVSMLFNLGLYEKFRLARAVKRLADFFLSYSAGALINLCVALTMLRQSAGNGPPYNAAVAGIAAGGVCNFLVNRFLAFKGRFIVGKSDSAPTSEPMPADRSTSDGREKSVVGHPRSAAHAMPPTREML